MMSRIEKVLTDMGYLDSLAFQQSPLHRLDPRVKLLTTLAFVVTVVSYPKYAFSGLLPLVLYPVVLANLAGLAPAYVMKKILQVSPFALLVGLFNPLFDRQILFQLGPLHLSGGWISFGSILLRFGLSVAAALVLIATTGFTGVCMALEKIKIPRIFAVQLLFLYRYIFVLVEEAARMVRARNLRSCDGRGAGLAVFKSLAGQLILRALDRARRIHLAMVCRGFDGEIRLLRSFHIGRQEILFFLGWVLYFILARLYPIPRLLEQGIMRLFA